MNTVRVAIAACLGALSANAQSVDSLEAFLTVTTEPEGAHIFVDSAFVGRSPLGGLRLTAGHHVLQALYPSAAEWRALNVRDTLELTPGDVVSRFYTMGTFVRIETVPPGAVVAARDSAIGITPFVYRSATSAAAELSLRKEGYADSTIAVVRSGELMRIVLSAAVSPSSEVPSPGDASTARTRSDGRWATYAAAATAIGFGIASAYFNLEANKNYDLYLSSADQKYLDATHRYDRAALWSLALTQVSFGVLTYLLLSE